MYPSASNGSFIVRVTCDLMSYVRTSTFEFGYPALDTYMYIRPDNLLKHQCGCLSGKYRERVGGNFRLVETDKSNQRIVGAEFQSTVEAELFFIHPVGNTVDYRILFAIFCDLAFPVAVKQLNKKYVIVAYKMQSWYRPEKRRGPVEVHRQTAVQ